MARRKGQKDAAADVRVTLIRPEDRAMSGDERSGEEHLPVSGESIPGPAIHVLARSRTPNPRDQRRANELVLAGQAGVSGWRQRKPENLAKSRSVVISSQPDSMASAAT